MSEVLWMNIPLMLLFIGLWAGIPLYFVLRHRHWHDKPELRTVPAYLTTPRRVRSGMIQVHRTSRYDNLISRRPLSDGANG